MKWPEGKFGAILADPPWFWKSYSDYAGHGGPVMSASRHAQKHYKLLDYDGLSALAVSELAARDCVLFIWVIWPHLRQALDVIEKWGFEYKTCAFSWIKGDASQLEMFQDHLDQIQIGLGFWTRANSEVCLLATRGSPKRLNADVKQAIVEPRREHSRKPDCVYERIERLVAGPYLELFARTQRPGWTSWGNEVDKFNAISA